MFQLPSSDNSSPSVGPLPAQLLLGPPGYPPTPTVIVPHNHKMRNSNPGFMYATLRPGQRVTAAGTAAENTFHEFVPPPPPPMFDGGGPPPPPPPPPPPLRTATAMANGDEKQALIEKKKRESAV